MSNEDKKEAEKKASKKGLKVKATPLIQAEEAPKAQKYARFNNSGFPTAFYDSSIHGDKIPEGCVELTEGQYKELVSNAGKRRWDGKKVVEDQEPSPAPTWEQVRKSRAVLLRESDWTQLLDAPISKEKQKEFADYRQKLRDITKTKNPEDVSLPEAPSL